MNDDKPSAGPPGDETQPVRPIPAQPGLPTPPPAAAAGETPAEERATATIEPAAEQPGGPTAAAPATAAAGAGRRGFRDRLGRLRSSDGNRAFGLAALIASALAGVIIGGLGVTAVQTVTDDHHDHDAWMQRGPMDRDGDDLGGRGPMHGAPPGMPGQVQPTTPPEGEDGSAS
jgi:hypothetical protein